MNRNLFVMVMLIMFMLFLSMITAIFSLGGNQILEIALMGLLLLWGVKIIYDILQYENVSKSMLIFFSIHLINQAYLLFRFSNIVEIILPIIVSTIGFVIAISLKEVSVSAHHVETEIIDLS